MAHLRMKVLLAIFSISAFLALTCGSFLIHASYQPFAYMELLETAEEEGIELPKKVDDPTTLNLIHKACTVIGSLTIISSLIFIWNAYDIAVLLCCGGKSVDHCLYNKNFKCETRKILSEKNRY